MTTMLLDSASLYFRAFYGVPDTMHAPDGSSTNAVRGFLDMIARLVQTHQPSGLVACTDEDWRPQFRVDAIPSYKAHRVAADPSQGEDAPDQLGPQVPVIVAVLDALGLCRCGVAGFEADDVIGTLATSLPGAMDVVTGDRDLFQLIDDQKRVRILYTARGVANLEIYDEARLVERYGIGGAAYADFAALRGDPSDGLPGVPGIGEKTAAVLINAYGNLASIRAAAAEPSIGASTSAGTMSKRQRESILASADYLQVAPIVVEVRRDVPVGDLDPTFGAVPADEQALHELGASWGIESSITRVREALAGLGHRS